MFNMLKDPAERLLRRIILEQGSLTKPQVQLFGKLEPLYHNRLSVSDAPELNVTLDCL